MREGQLFRKQAAEHRDTRRSHGDVLILPVARQSIVVSFLLAWVVVTAVWLSTSTYARRETVRGWLEPSGGVLAVYAGSPGTVYKMLVEDDELVEAGQPLIVVRGDRVLTSGESLDSVLLEEYDRQSALLEERLARAEVAAVTRDSGIAQRISSLEEDLTFLNGQLEILEERSELASTRSRSILSLKQSGYASSVAVHEADEARLELLSERQALLRERASKRNMLDQLKLERQIAATEHADAVDDLRSQISKTNQLRAQLSSETSYVIRASRSGTVTNLQVREGDSVGTKIPLLSIVGAEATLTAHVLVPVTAAGFVRTGQQLEIRYDAFPYQKFGLYEAGMTALSRSILLPHELHGSPIPTTEPVYRGIANLETTAVEAYGQSIKLKPGMTFSADIQLDRRSLVDWLLEPIYSLQGKI
ncbi:MAG: HlyD family efflux transporter periplasmic adaptor subunit [Pseudomonadota bacterium]